MKKFCIDKSPKSSVILNMFRSDSKDDSLFKVSDSVNSRNYFKRLLRIIILLIFTGLFFYYFSRYRSDFSVLSEIRLFDIVLILLGQVFVIITNAWLLAILCNVQKYSLAFFESLIVTLKASIINFFGFLQGGVGYKAVYLRKKHGIPYKKFLTLLFANYLAVFLMSSLLGLIGTFILLLRGKHINYSVALMLLITTFICILIIFFGKFLHFKSRLKPLLIFNEIASDWQLIAQQKQFIFQILGVALLQSILLGFVFYVELNAIGTTPNIEGVLVYSSLANLALFVAITPAAIGFREAILIFSQQTLGVSTSELLISSTLDRIIYFCILALSAIFIQDFVLKIIFGKDSVKHL